MMAKKMAPEPVMVRARQLFEESQLTLEQLGERMGYESEARRTSAWQFLNKTADPRLSMLRRFAKAMGVDVKDLL